MYKAHKRKKMSTQPSNYNTDEGFCSLWKHFSDLIDNPELRELKKFKTCLKIVSDSVRALRQKIIDIQFSI